MQKQKAIGPPSIPTKLFRILDKAVSKSLTNFMNILLKEYFPMF